jgi:DNA-binding NarL/FixJ family response regulator
MSGLDVILTDVAMPGGLGPQVAAEARRTHPRVRLLYTSTDSRKDPSDTASTWVRMTCSPSRSC